MLPLGQAQELDVVTNTLKGLGMETPTVKMTGLGCESKTRKELGMSLLNSFSRQKL